MPPGLSTGGPFRPFSRAISARSSALARLSSATSPSSRITSSLSAAAGSSSRSGGRLTEALTVLGCLVPSRKYRSARTLPLLHATCVPCHLSDLSACPSAHPSDHLRKVISIVPIVHSGATRKSHLQMECYGSDVVAPDFICYRPD